MRCEQRVAAPHRRPRRHKGRLDAEHRGSGKKAPAPAADAASAVRVLQDDVGRGNDLHEQAG